MNETKAQKDDDGKFVHSVAERKELGIIMKELAEQIKELEKEKRNKESDVSITKKIYNTLHSELQHLRKERGKKGDVRAKMESVMRKQFGMQRPAYHGGDLTGVTVKHMLQNVEKLFDKFKK